jgi:serine/threonine-protein kinase
LLSDRESIKVADLWIGRLSESDEAQQNQVGLVLDTPRYMSPEQSLWKSIDGRSDLFLVGNIM